ncbi:lysozyme inhibitor LprI family protein [Methylorubrum rhodesianum]|jgi:uncharacterized protein YecT (DUF1311 family)|uniref:lysozyme inhibitor LprI family protein n=1 Tax=Methylorubrum rhodesianum TaxID=29427 RepID=UPI003745C462
MSRLFAAAVLGAYVGMLVTMTFTPQAMAAPERPTPETCSMDDPTACLDRHGEAAARALDKAYADAASKLSAACAEVISPGIGACLERAWQIADKELNETYARAMKSIENDEAGRKWREQLKLAQQAWLRIRDADCGDLVFSEWMNGTGAGAAAVACQVGHTVARTAELRRRYDRR